MIIIYNINKIMSDEKRYVVVLLGAKDVGKSEMIAQLQKNKFSPDGGIMAQFIRYTAKLTNGKSVCFDVWDTPGQQEYSSSAILYLKTADVVILNYDITNEKSFIELKEFWYKKAKDNLKKKAIFAVAANRSELYEKQKVSNNDGEEFAESIGAIFAKTSSVSESGTFKLFEKIGNKIIESKL